MASLEALLVLLRPRRRENVRDDIFRESVENSESKVFLMWSAKKQLIGLKCKSILQKYKRWFMIKT